MTTARVAAATLMTMLAAATVWAQVASVDEILSKLRGGGYVIVLRHGATHADQADTDPLNLDNVAKQRQLNDKGRADARAHARRRVQASRRTTRSGVLESVPARCRNGAADCRHGAGGDG
jgi:hypothetical protein